jgi:5-methylcytosine-specific restriction endonuclease McrA/predicted nucleic acid-binding Zn ribbon protein
MDEHTCPWCPAVLTNPQRATCGAENCVRLQRLALKVDEPKPARPCDYCGEPLPADAPSYRRFCNATCQGRNARGIVVPTGRQCVDCGKAIPDGAHPLRRFCDRSCKTRDAYKRNRVVITARVNAWKARNEAHTKAWHAAYRERHREYLSASQRRDYRRDPLPWKNARDRRRALLAQGAGVVTSADWRKLVARFDGCCAYCGQRCTPTMEHVVPLSRGGRHAIGNLIPACLKCNLSKNNRFIMEWRLGRSAPRTRRAAA